MEQAYAVIGNLLDDETPRIDRSGAVLAAKLSNDGGISWSQTMEIAASGFTTHHAVGVQNNHRARLGMTRIEVEAMDVMAHGSSRKVVEEMVTIRCLAPVRWQRRQVSVRGHDGTAAADAYRRACVPKADVDLSDAA